MPLVPGNQDWGESKSIRSERGNFLLKPSAPGDIIHVRALAAAAGRVLPQDRKRGVREQGWGTPAPSPPHLEEGGCAGTWGKEEQQDDGNLAGKIQLQRHRRLSELQGHRRLCRPLTEKVWRGDPAAGLSTSCPSWRAAPRGPSPGEPPDPAPRPGLFHLVTTPGTLGTEGRGSP